jgi:hypothetical protein
MCSCVERLQRTNGKCTRNGCDKAFDSVFVPYPTALKIRKLNNTLMTVFKKLE